MATAGFGNVLTGTPGSSTTTATSTTSTTSSAPPAPTASLVNLTPHVKGGGSLTLSAAGSVIPRGQRASLYTFQLGTGSGAVTTTCPGQFPRLNTVVTHATTTKASVTVNTSAGTSATTSTLVTVSRLVIAPLHPPPKPRGFAPERIAGIAAARALYPQSHTSSKRADIGTIGALAFQCLPAGGVKPGPSKSKSLHGVEAAVQASTTGDPQLPACASALNIGIIKGLGCFTPVNASHPLGSAEGKLLCGHVGAGGTGDWRGARKHEIHRRDVPCGSGGAL